MGLRQTLLPLRSFHLTPSASDRTDPVIRGARSTTRAHLPLPSRNKLDIVTHGATIVVLATLVSLIFISTIAIALVGRNPEHHGQFITALDDVARFNPGIVLVGEDIDVDIDQPSVTIHWSLIACGTAFVLPGSKGLLGNPACGLPSNMLNIFVDNDIKPLMHYDPALIPFDEDTGKRRRIETAVQFESSHVLDVHEARQYPFDTYRLQTELRAVSETNRSEPISRVLTIGITSSFNIETVDSRTYVVLEESIEAPCQHVDIHVRRPASIRLFTVLLFAINWLLAHINIGQVVLARKSTGLKSVLCHLAIGGGSIIALPHIRNSMPDAPGLDGVIIDCIGFFPQMAIIGLCLVALLLMLGVREWDRLKTGSCANSWRSSEQTFCFPDRLHSIPRPTRPRRPPPLDSNPTDLAQWEMERMMKQLRGEYMFPPLSPVSPRSPTTPTGASSWKPFHKRATAPVRPMSMLEAGEVSKWSDHED